jgi:hypothetical protein
MDAVKVCRSDAVTTVTFSGNTTDTKDAYDTFFAATHAVPVISRTNPSPHTASAGVVVAAGVVVRSGAAEPRGQI